MSALPSPHPFFLARDQGQRLAILHRPAVGVPVRSVVLHVHAFAEEMNKARRMVAQQARALAQAGHAVLLLDLAGCGDSSGDFGDATWDAWLDDVLAGCDWLRRELPGAPLWLWGLRAGCLLACAAAARLSPAAAGLLLWQPPASGQQVLTQFLRLKAAGSLADGQAKAALEAVRRQLAQGEAAEIAGYALSAALAEGLAAATLSPPATPGRLVWRELSSRPEPALSPAADKPLAAWRGAGWQVQAAAVAGPAFWQTTEIEDAPALLQSTTAALAPVKTEALA